MEVKLINALRRKKEFVKYIQEGKIFLYPTDTVYGLGCDATNEKSVERIKEIKGRTHDKPLSVIAPSLEWIQRNFDVNEIEIKEMKKRFPGPYTFLLKKKLPHFMSYVSPNERIGVRIINSTFQDIVQESGLPFITTSANFSGEKPHKKLEDIPKELKEKVDIIIDSGMVHGTPSTIVEVDERGYVIEKLRIK